MLFRGIYASVPDLLPTITTPQCRSPPAEQSLCPAFNASHTNIDIQSVVHCATPVQCIHRILNKTNFVINGVVVILIQRAAPYQDKLGVSAFRLGLPLSSVSRRPLLFHKWGQICTANRAEKTIGNKRPNWTAERRPPGSLTPPLALHWLLSQGVFGQRSAYLTVHVCPECFYIHFSRLTHLSALHCGEL